ncbi:MAG: Fic family protein [Spirochaetia bacterium]|nr:Fic family protein [Spirochaetia bacterium]
MIEKAPEISINSEVLKILINKEYDSSISDINEEYLYWDKVKYKVPAGFKAEDFWTAVKISRKARSTSLDNFSICISSYLPETKWMQEILHNFDMNFGGTLASSDIISDKNRQYYLISSIMEEAIASSQMEGAATTRKAAKEMLRRQAKPKDKSQQMILNNYNTINYLSEHKNDDLSPELILEIHRQITEKTLDDPMDEGKFRTDNNISVVDVITGEIAHTPPSFTVINETIHQLCKFANEDRPFIHPIIKAIILHFIISYLHPFVDGNGRTARSLFYWYMLKKGYWMTEYLAISRVIYKSKSQYEKSFLYTEQDDFDLGYFIQYNLKALKQAFEELQIYLARKAHENNALLEYKIPGLNERQIQIVKIYVEKPASMFTSRDLETRFNVSVKTLRSDLQGLVSAGLIETVAINKRLKGYIRSMNFEHRLEEIREN